MVGTATGLILALGTIVAFASPNHPAGGATVAHECAATGDDGHTQGVFCVDLLGFVTAGGQDVERKVQELCRFVADYLSRQAQP
jgi:hypothetical protein